MLDLGAEAGILPHQALGLVQIGPEELAKQVVTNVDPVAHTPSSSIRVRIRSKAWIMRILTVPSGVEVRSAISR